MQTLLFFVVLRLDKCMVPSKVFHWILIFCVLSWVSYLGINKDGCFCKVQHIFSCPSNWGQVSLCLSHFHFLTVLFDTLKAIPFPLLFFLEQANSHCVVCVILWDILNTLQVSRLCLLVFVMNIFRLIFFCYTFIYITPFETRIWQWLTHCPTIKIICIIIHNVVVFFVRIIICKMWIVCFCMSFWHHTYATMHTFFYKEMHINVLTVLNLSLYT